MTVIGLTGPTGAGKTTALEVLAGFGFEIVDCDALYYHLLRTDGELRQKLANAFGPVFLPDGELNRRALAGRVFSDKKELDKLNAIVFPAMSAAVEQKIRKCSQKGLVIDAVNLIESGMGELCAATVAVTAPPALRLKRIMARDGLPEPRPRPGSRHRSRIAGMDGTAPSSWKTSWRTGRPAGNTCVDFSKIYWIRLWKETEKNGRERMEKDHPHREKERI